MTVCLLRGYPPARRALEKAALDKIGFVDIFQRAHFFRAGHSQRLDADRPSVEMLDQQREDLAIHLVQPLLVHVKAGKGVAGLFSVDYAVAVHSGKISHATQQTVGYARCSPRATAYFQGSVFRYGNIEDARGAHDHAGKFLRRIKFQPVDNSEAIPQR